MRQVIKGLGPDAPLPSSNQIAQQFGISIKTARKAVGVLEAEGLVRVVPSKGAFVRARDS